MRSCSIDLHYNGLKAKIFYKESRRPAWAAAFAFLEVSEDIYWGLCCRDSPGLGSRQMVSPPYLARSLIKSLHKSVILI